MADLIDKAAVLALPRYEPTLIGVREDRAGMEVCECGDFIHAAAIAALPAQGVMSAVGNLPAVHAAHEIRLGVLAETIDPLQGYVTKEDCALYVAAILAAYRGDAK